ncbi:MAG: redoxin domain-containing protein [Planctomycetes bacterium]|nr:redoxin domain-containing protein [Planctomycetota bacterium]
MRRYLLGLAVMLLAAGIAFRFGALTPPPEAANAQEPSTVAPASREEVADPFTIPESAEVAVLVNFVKALRTVRPELGPALDEFEEKAPAAIRKACERIIDLEKSATSEARRFAQRELLPFRMSDLAESDKVTVEARKQIAADAIQILKDSERSASDVELATRLAITFEEFAPADESLALYEALGELFVRNTNEAIARRGEYLTGAARRLGIVGHRFELVGTTVDGTEFDIASWKGKVVLVDFWATWCGHCLDELPNLKRNYREFHDKGFEIVGISVDDDREALQTFLKKQRLPWTTLHDEDTGSEHQAAIQYGIAAYPTSFLIDRDGRVLATDLRGRKLSRKLDELCGSGNNQRPGYPVFNVSEVIDKLTNAGSRLYKSGKTRGDVELRQQLDRKSIELKLPEPNDELLTDRELYRRACNSVFIVCSLYKVAESNDWQTSLATAFAVTSDGVLTTSCHVFDNEDEADAVVVMDVHRKVYPVKELLAVHKRADTCLFRIDATDLQPLPFADDAPPGTRVRVLGHPGDSFYFLSSGLLANYERDHEGTTWLNTTADFGQGSSGGPVLDEFGNVVGQVSRTYTLYAGGTTRGRPRRVAGPMPGDKREREVKDEPEDIADPQMVFKSCVPVKTLRSLVKP